MALIESFILFLITFLIGYFLGLSRTSPETTQSILKGVRKTLTKSRVGAVKRPDSQKLYMMQNKDYSEGINETRRAFDSLQTPEPLVDETKP